MSTKRMRYNRALQMWEGQLPDGRRIYVSEHLYEEAYARHLGEKPRGRGPQLYAMTRPDYWQPIAESYQTELGSDNPEAFTE